MLTENQVYIAVRIQHGHILLAYNYHSVLLLYTVFYHHSGLLLRYRLARHHVAAHKAQSAVGGHIAVYQVLYGP